MSLIVFRPTYN